MDFDLSKIEQSINDINKGVNFPRILSEELAEFIGIMIGDGHLGIYNIIRKGKNVLLSDLNISGNKNEEDYLRYIMNLFHSLFNIKLNYRRDSTPNSIMLRIHSRGIVQFLTKLCEIPSNRKAHIVRIPPIIKESDNNIKYAFLRGLADTDFSVTFKNRTNKGHNYPVIKGSFKSRNLILDLELIFSELGFRYCTLYDEIIRDPRFKSPIIMHSIYLNGKANFRKWIELIGFSNPKFQKKTEKWLTDGFCPPGYGISPWRELHPRPCDIKKISEIRKSCTSHTQ